MRIRIVLATLALAIAAMAATAAVAASGATHYRWRDGHGVLHFSDSLPPDAVKYGYELINDQGIVVRTVERALTPQERKQREAAAAIQAAAARQARDRARADRQMLAAYPQESDLQQAQQEQLSTIDQTISTTELNLKSQERTLADLLQRAAEIEHTQKTVPKFISDDIARQRAVVNAQREALAKARSERAATVQAQAAQMAHYRSVKQQQDTAASAASSGP
jgi:hypothetical protein